MLIKEVSAKEVKDSRGEKTIQVSVKTDEGKFITSAPAGKSTGKYEAKSYSKSLQGDINFINDLDLEKINDLDIEVFEDLIDIEKLVEKEV